MCESPGGKGQLQYHEEQGGELWRRDEIGAPIGGVWKAGSA